MEHLTSKDFKRLHRQNQTMIQLLTGLLIVSILMVVLFAAWWIRVEVGGAMQRAKLQRQLEAFEQDMDASLEELNRALGE